MKTKLKAVIILFATFAGIDKTAAQTTNSWATGLSGKWEPATNWTINVSPTNNSLVFITNATTKTVTIDATTALSNTVNSCMTISNLTVSAPAGSKNLLLVSNPGTTNPLIISRTFTLGSGGALTISNGEVQVRYVNVATPFTDDGEVLLTTPEARLIETNSGVAVGYLGQGILTISNGLVMADGMNIGLNPGSAGTLTVAGGTNQVVLAQALRVGNSGASGTVWVTGGRLDVPAVATISVLGYFGDGRMTVSNGTVNIPYFEVTQEAAGTLTLAGGTMTSSTRFDVGFSAAILKTGTVWITGGALITSNAPTTLGAGAAGGNGRLILSNGTWLAGTVNMGRNANCQGTLTVAGGTNTFFSSLTVGDETNTTGAVWLTDTGRLVITNATTVIGARGTGQMTTSNGVFLATVILLGTNTTATGTLTVAGGINALTGPLTVGGAGTAAVWVTGGQLVVTNLPASVGAGNGFAIDGSVTLTNGSSLNVSNVNTIIGNTGSGSLTVFGGSFVGNGLMLIGYNGVGTVLQSGGQTASSGEILGFNPGAQGTLTVAGGTHNASGGLTLGDNGFAAGAVWVTGGQLLVTNNSTTLLVGDAGVGQLTVSNGTVLSLNADVGVLPGGTGTLTTAGGTNTALSTFTIGDNPTANGAVWLTGGRFAVSNSMNVGRYGIGQMTVSNGTTYSVNVLVAAESGSQGTLTAAGGTNSIDSSLLVGTFDCTATGIVIVAGGSLFVTNAAHNAVLEVRSGTVQLNSGTLTVDKLVLTNACGHFIKAGGTLSVTTTNLDPNLSAAGDGIPNSWKQQYGFDPFDPTVASADPDGDGCNNLCEFLTGGNPLADIKSIGKQGNDVRVTWQAAANKTNALQRSSGSNGSYSNNFADVFVVTNSPGTVTNYLDVGAATNSPARYYRVRLVP